MALDEKKMLLCELYSEKERLKLTHEAIAQKMGVSTKSVQRYLKEPEVIAMINKLCAEKLDTMLPAVVHNTEIMLSSNSSNDKIKGQESFWKLQEKMDKIQQGQNISREQEIVQKSAEMMLEVYKDIFEPEFLINFIIQSVSDYVINRKYDHVVDVKEIDKFLREHGR